MGRCLGTETNGSLTKLSGSSSAVERQLPNSLLFNLFNNLTGYRGLPNTCKYAVNEIAAGASAGALFLLE